MTITVEVPVREVYLHKYGDYIVRERQYNGRWKNVSQFYMDKKNAQAKLGRLVLADIEADKED